VDPSREAVLLDGRPLVARERITLALHKPEGPVTTLSDPEGRETVYHLLPELEGWVFAIGRLDAQTSGLLLFTNDAALADLVAGDRSRLEKRYEATVRGVPSDEALARLAAGVEVRLEDGSRYRTRPARAERLPSPPGASGRGRLALTIVEGKNRQVRRMCAALGHEVTALRRTRIGPIELGDLALGACRALSPAEVEALREAATLAAARSRR
jgi:23S rRNA pseudouridine2605 synthase